jgi:hypothetical protein
MYFYSDFSFIYTGDSDNEKAAIRFLSAIAAILNNHTQFLFNKY